MRSFAPALFAAIASGKWLTQQTWDSAVAGKQVFVKFMVPWCPHCQAMQADWESLMRACTSDAVLIGKVDCTADHSESLCHRMGATAYPTLKYGNPNNLQPYPSGRSFLELKNFVENNFGKCPVDTGAPQPQASQATAMVVQPDGTCGPPRCDRPPLPPLEPPKVSVSKANTYTIKKISKKTLPVQEAILKKVVDPELMEVPCVHEHEAYTHNHQECPACPDAKSAQETVKKVEWDVTLMREKLNVYVKVPAKKRLVYEHEKPRISGEILLVHKPSIKKSEIRVKKCAHQHPNEIENRGDCDLPPPQPTCGQPTCGQPTCGQPTCR